MRVVFAIPATTFATGAPPSKNAAIPKTSCGNISYVMCSRAPMPFETAATPSAIHADRPPFKAGFDEQPPAPGGLPTGRCRQPFERGNRQTRKRRRRFEDADDGISCTTFGPTGHANEPPIRTERARLD